MLVERESELSALDGRLDALDAGRGGVLVLEAGAGLGKSRLLDEAAARAARRGVRVLRARAFESEGEFPFAVALQLLEPPAVASREQPEALFAGAAELARALLQGTTAEDERPRTPFATIHGLYWVVANLATARPLLLCVDDLHWCDEASLRFLSYLAARLQELPVTVVAALRHPGAGESAALAQCRGTRAGVRAPTDPRGDPRADPGLPARGRTSERGAAASSGRRPARAGCRASGERRAGG